MRKLVLLLLTFTVFSCTENEEDYCNPECWEVINVKRTSIKIYQRCIDEAIRIQVPSNHQYTLNQVLCGDQVPN